MVIICSCYRLNYYSDLTFCITLWLIASNLRISILSPPKDSTAMVIDQDLILFGALNLEIYILTLHLIYFVLELFYIGVHYQTNQRLHSQDPAYIPLCFPPEYPGSNSRLASLNIHPPHYPWFIKQEHLFYYNSLFQICYYL